MAKLTKLQARNHQKALEILEQDILTDEDKEFVFNHYHEGAASMNGTAGAFFTSLDLAWDVALDLTGGSATDNGARMVDLCAGIGVLSYALLKREPNLQITCIEINPDYVEAGKKLVPEADWYCMDVTDLDALRKLGPFWGAISNPPFGTPPSFKDKRAPNYTGPLAEYKVLDIAAEVARYASFILPQGSAGFRLSGVHCYQADKNEKVTRFEEQTGIELVPGLALDTTCYTGFKDVSIPIEVVDPDFPDRDRKRRPQIEPVRYTGQMPLIA